MRLQEFFEENPNGALAFSGGVDSSYLAYAAANYGYGWRAYYVHSAFQPAFELEDARKISEQCGIPMTVLERDVLCKEEVVANPFNRCYYCKRIVFSSILEQAAGDGCKLVIDGTNASDDADDRPGMKALRELEVRSPLRECGLTKADVRRLSRETGLFTWNKPSYACLATRIPTGTKITAEALQQVETGETRLAAMGYRDFRIRLHGKVAVVQLPQELQDRAWHEKTEILAQLSPIFPLVTIDLQARKAFD
ncbi:hypothetical protein OBV_12500 [Oscillibacter valericigenes Sjm18-20]|nr:hypothetical protein OBV_12500 [Oscillibacter valericigenes Sjm18-20]